MLKRKFLSYFQWLLGVIIVMSLILAARVQPAMNPNLTDELETHRHLWNAQQIERYQFTYQKQCFCPPPGNTPLKLTVNGDEILQATDLKTGQAIDTTLPDFYKTINQLFSVIEEAIERNADEISVTYDPSLGYPTHIFIDYQKILADEEVGYTAADLVQIN